jgi:hypothetical protein
MTMDTDDRFLHDHRRDPGPGFTRRLRERLRVEEERSQAPAWRPLVAAAASLIVVASMFAFPSVRAWAQSVLDQFRVRNFVAVSFDPERMEKLRSLDQDNAMMVFDRKLVIQEPGPPVVLGSIGEASSLAGIPVEAPAYLPDSLALDSVAVTGEGRARFGVSTERLRELLASLDLRDIEVPAGLDGQELSVHMYPMVAQRYRAGNRRLRLVQARSPEVSLPGGVDLARLGEIGLRILGLDAGEARRLAASVDWRSTLLIPVPSNASSFRKVSVQGNPGLFVTTVREGKAGQRRRSGSVVMWTEGDRVFALEGTMDESDLMQVAESVR